MSVLEVIAGARHDEPVVFQVGGGTAVVYSRSFKAATGEAPVANDDGALIAERSGALLLAVADGVGGLPRGDEAARAALEALGAAFLAGERVEDCFERANEAVRELRGPASTLVVALIEDGTLHTFHAGDSQALVVGGRGRLKAETMPHTVVGHGTEAGLLEAEDAALHPERHIVTNVLGEKVLRLERTAWGPLAQRDVVLLASDGLFDNLTATDVAQRVHKGPLPAAVRRLVQETAEAMLSGREGTKPDDLTVLAWRRDRPERGRAKASAGDSSLA